MCCWLPILYCDLYHVPARHYSIDPGHWKHIIDCLDDGLQFLKLQRAQASRLAAHCWQFDIKLSLAKRIYIKFVYLNAGLGCEFAILPQFADH